MAVMTAHPPGTFCWSELSTTDPADAKRFYGELFGWTANDTPLGDGKTYSMMQVEGHDAAALRDQQEEERAAKVPPGWRAYVAVTGVDEVSRRIADAEGEVLTAPFDVFDAGRMALVKDPTGAVFAIWQARNHIGAEWIAGTGGVAWNELLTRDTAAASQFYARVFGWAAEAQSGPIPYTVFKNAGRPVGGMLAISEEMGPMPPHWNIYFAVDDCDAAAARAAPLGGRLLTPPVDIASIGRVATLADAQGATFSIMKSADAEGE